jgi:predicted phosphodiesterase
MRIALLSDIHGNEIALRAVLEDIAARGGADAYWILGDLVALGPQPVRVLEILSGLPNARFIRGNTDRYVGWGDRPSPSVEEAEKDSRLLGALVEVANTFAWTQGMITASGWLPWLQALPSEIRSTLPGGTRFLGVHASPGRDDGPGIVPLMNTTEIAPLLKNCNADLVCVGHTHCPSEHKVDGVHVVNLGAVSLSITADKYANYVLLDTQKDAYHVQNHSVPYDRAAVIDQLNCIGHPGRGYLIRHLSNWAIAESPLSLRGEIEG